MAKRKFPKGMDNRKRDRDGEIRRKRSDPLVGTLRDARKSRIGDRKSTRHSDGCAGRAAVHRGGCGRGSAG